MPQRNALPGLIFVIIFGAGLLVSLCELQPGQRWRKRRDCGRELLRRLDRRQCDQGRQSVGAGRRAEARQVPLARGPGLFFIVPIIDTVAYWIDIRVITEHVQGRKDDDPRHRAGRRRRGAVLEGGRSEDGGARRRRLCAAINWAAQTALRDVIGKTMLADMLEGREKLSAELQRIIDARTEPWGINVISVEVQDVLIPAALQDAMSMQAQAERERQARVILGDSERQVAEKFAEAAKTYANNPTAFHLRAMNMLYEGLKAATRRSSSCPRRRSSRCSSAACRRWRRWRAPSRMRRPRGRRAEAKAAE